MEEGGQSSSSSSSSRNLPTYNVETSIQDKEFGFPCRFSGRQLPTVSDVLRYLFFLYNDQFRKDNKCEPLESFSTPIARNLDKIWKVTSIPTIQYLSIVNKLKRLIDQYRDCMKHKDRSKYRNLIEMKNTLFDIAKTYTILEKDGRQHARFIKETHVVISKEPGSIFLGFATPGEASDAPQTANVIIKFFNDKNISMENLIAVSCDGERKNTGRHAGILKSLEKHLKKTLHWFVCLIHFNELPFKALFNHLDGPTDGPQTRTGDIGKQLENCETLEVKNFMAISLENMPQNFEKGDLSTDEDYIIEIATAVSTGICPVNLANKKTGPMHNARWLTTASRVLRLYVATDKPSENLIILVKYIMQVYVPMYFNVKSRNSSVFGSVHLFNFITYTRSLTSHLLPIVQKVIQNNSYFAHPENLILAMLFDERQDIRKLGCEKILLARGNGDESAAIREYIHPTINFQCTD